MPALSQNAKGIGEDIIMDIIIITDTILGITDYIHTRTNDIRMYDFVYDSL